MSEGKLILHRNATLALFDDLTMHRCRVTQLMLIVWSNFLKPLWNNRIHFKLASMLAKVIISSGEKLAYYCFAVATANNLVSYSACLWLCER